MSTKQGAKPHSTESLQHRTFDVEDHPVVAHLRSLLTLRDLSESVREDEAPLVTSQSRCVVDTLIRVLFRSEQANVVITGESGVGKTALLDVFAAACRSGDPSFLASHRILYLDVEDVGLEDSRACLESIFQVARDVSPVVLCLDGITSLIKRANGGTNSPLFRSLLKTPNVKVVGTATPWDYADRIGNDARMLREFTQVELVEPDKEGLTRIAAHVAQQFSTKYSLKISDETADRAIALSSVFMMSERQPAKTIQVLRQACEDTVYRRQEQSQPQTTISDSHIVSVISDRTGIPYDTISGQGLEGDVRTPMLNTIVGQDAAIDEVAMELELISAGLVESSKPASVMMFAGMTGVGKTELAKRIAALYSSSGHLQVYPMGNFTEQHSVSGIIGVPPGYVGHEEGGRLINDLRSDPYSVFLLDEAEKCHPNIWKPFLTLFDEGWIADQRGVKAYADRAIFILTTNAGDRSIAQLVRSGKPKEEIIQHVRKTLSRVRQERSSQPVFPPQFLSRIRRIIVFNPLDESAMIGIAERISQKISKRWLAARNRKLVVTPEVIESIGKQAAELNEASNGQEGGRIVQKLFAEQVEYTVLTASKANPNEYESCQEIQITRKSVNEESSYTVTFT